MDWSFLLEKEFLKTALSSFFGGILALAGTYITIRIQNSSNLEEKKKMYCSFYNEQISSLKNYINDIDKIMKTNGYISFQHVRQIQMVFDLVNRHFDGLVFIKDNKKRSEIRNFFFDTYFDSIILENNENKTDEIKKILKEENTKIKQDEMARSVEDFNMNKRSIIIRLKERSAEIEPIRDIK